MKEKRFSLERLAALTIVLIGGGLLVFFLLRSVLPLVLPFLIAWLLAFPVRCVARFLKKRFRIPYKVGSVILILLSLFLILFFVIWGSLRLFDEFGRLIVYLGEHPEMTDGIFSGIRDFFTEHFSFLPMFGEGESDTTLSELLSAFLERSVTIVAELITGLVRSLPSAIFGFAVTVIAALYFAMDLDKINRGAEGLLPPFLKKMIGRMKGGATKTAAGYFRSFVIIFGMNFLLLYIGLLILGQEYALVLALIFSVLDLLPVVGIGISLIPWGIYSLATGNLFLGTGLLILYGAITLLRQFIEPRLIGGGIGLHPLITLLAITLGGGFLGLFGMLIGPIIAIGIKGVWVCLSEEKGTASIAEQKEKTGG